MRDVKIFIFTGSSVVDHDISKVLEHSLKGFAISFTTDILEAELVITTPDFRHKGDPLPVLLLTDSISTYQECENAVDFSPFPVTEDDILRLEFRIIGAIDNLRDYE